MKQITGLFKRFKRLSFKKYLIIALIFIALIPYETRICEKKGYTFVDYNNRPVEDITVKQVSQFYSYENNSTVLQKKPNEDGNVVFPSRAIRINLLLRLFSIVSDIFRLGINMDYGPSCFYVFVDFSAEKNSESQQNSQVTDKNIIIDNIEYEKMIVKKKK